MYKDVRMGGRLLFRINPVSGVIQIKSHGEIYYVPVGDYIGGEIMKGNIWRVVRDDKQRVKFIQRLSEPDAAGNRAWITQAAIPYEALVELGGAVKQAWDLHDDELIAAVVLS